MEKELTAEDIVAWIISHTDDEAAMDKINRVTFPFTSRYSARYSRQESNTVLPTPPNSSGYARYD